MQTESRDFGRMVIFVFSFKAMKTIFIHPRFLFRMLKIAGLYLVFIKSYSEIWSLMDTSLYRPIWKYIIDRLVEIVDWKNA
jgi:hypothetical protein